MPTIIQQEIVHIPTIIQQEIITQQHDEMNAHWTKQPAQRVADVSFDVISAVYGPYFPYEDELSGAHQGLAGLPAPSITRVRRLFCLAVGL